MDTDAMDKKEQVEILRRTTNMLIKHVRMVNEQHDLLVDQKRSWIQEYENLVDDYDTLKNITQSNDNPETSEQKHHESNKTQQFRSLHEDIEYLEKEYERQLAFKRMIRKKVFENEDLEKTLMALTKNNEVKLSELDKIRTNTEAFDAKLHHLTDRLVNSCYNFNAIMDDSQENDLQNKKTPSRYEDKHEMTVKSRDELKERSEVIAGANKEFITCLNKFKRGIQKNHDYISNNHNDYITQRDLSSIGPYDKGVGEDKRGYSPNKTDRIREKIEEALKCSQNINLNNPLLKINNCFSNQIPKINTSKDVSDLDKKYDFRTHRLAERKDTHGSIFRTPGQEKNNLKCKTPEKNLKFSPSPIASQINDTSDQFIGETVKKYTTAPHVDIIHKFDYDSPSDCSNILRKNSKLDPSQGSGLNSKIGKMLDEYEEKESKNNYEIIVLLNTIDKLNLDLAKVTKSSELLLNENFKLQNMVQNPQNCSIREETNENKESTNTDSHYIETPKPTVVTSTPHLPPSGKNTNHGYNTNLSTNSQTHADANSHLSFDKKIQLLINEKNSLLNEKDNLICENNGLFEELENLSKELEGANDLIKDLGEKNDKLESNIENYKQIKGQALNEVKCLMSHNEQLEKNLEYYQEKAKNGYSNDEYQNKNDDLQKTMALYTTLQSNNAIIKKESEQQKEEIGNLKFEVSKLRTNYHVKLKKNSLSFQIDKRKLEHELLEQKIDLDSDLPSEIIEGLRIEKDNIALRIVDLCSKLETLIKDAGADSDRISSDFGLTETDRVLQIPLTETDRVLQMAEKVDDSNNCLKPNFEENLMTCVNDSNLSIDKDLSVVRSQKLSDSKSNNQGTPANNKSLNYNNSTNIYATVDTTKNDSNNSSYNNETYCEERERQKIKELKKQNNKLKENLNDCKILLADKENESIRTEEKFDKLQKNMTIRLNNKQKSIVEIHAQLDKVTEKFGDLQSEFSELQQNSENKNMEFEYVYNELEKLKTKGKEKSSGNELQNQLNSAQNPFLKVNVTTLQTNTNKYETEEDLFVQTEDYIPSQTNINYHKNTLSSENQDTSKSNAFVKKINGDSSDEIEKDSDKKSSPLLIGKDTKSPEEIYFLKERIKYQETIVIDLKSKYELDTKEYSKVKEENKELQLSLFEMVEKSNVLQEVEVNCKRKQGTLFYELLNSGQKNQKGKRHELKQQKSEAVILEKNIELHGRNLNKVMKISKDFMKK